MAIQFANPEGESPVLTPRIRTALVALAASAALAGCTNMGPYGGIGVGVSSGYGGYGYGDYGYGYGSPYGGYYGGYPYYGWYDGFYYPGSGYWVYDPDGHPRPITDKQKGYWANLLAKARQANGASATAAIKENWSGFSKQGRVAAPVSVGATASGQADQKSVRQIAEARRAAQVERRQVQAERQQARSEQRESARQQILERRESRRATRAGKD
jgi:hypothetical protein